MFILLVLQTVSSIERCPPFTFLYRLHCIHIAIQIPVIYRLHCTHTPLSCIALSSLLAHLLPVFTSHWLCFNHWCTHTHTQNVSWVECGRGHMVRNESFSLRDICIWVRFDKYNTINRSCSGDKGGGGGGGWGEKGGRKADKAVGGKEREIEEYQYGLRGMPAT